MFRRDAMLASRYRVSVSRRNTERAVGQLRSYPPYIKKMYLT
nr:hypothetical protein [Candidatus Parabeggiatoa sp.]